jgi:hypothetical protein
MPQIKPALVKYVHVVHDEAGAYDVVNVRDVLREHGQLEIAEALLEHSKHALHDLAG